MERGWGEFFMELGKLLYVKDRKTWRAWLRKNHKTEPEIWLVFYKKSSGKERIPYNDSVEEALCFGWIDSTLKPIDEHCYAQRFSPRRKKSQLSEMNKERVRRLIKTGRMTKTGLDSISHHLEGKPHKLLHKNKLAKFVLPEDILKKLKSDPIVWKNFNKFPKTYKTIRIGWINGARHRPEVFKQRLNYFIKMTARNKKFGMVQ